MKAIKGILVKTLLALWVGMHSATIFSMELSPCWFNNPVNQHQFGFIGTASPFSVKANGSLIASRQRALSKLIDYYELKLDLSELDFTQSRLTISPELNVIFAPTYTDSQAMYAYVSIEKRQDSPDNNKQQQWLRQECPVQTCDFKQCTPNWLCQSKEQHLISVSQTTSIPAQQLDKTYDNAQTLLQFILKSKIDDYSYQVKSEGQFQQWGYLEHQGTINALANKNKLLNTHSCQTPTYMFAQYNYAKSNLTNNQTKPDSEINRSPPFTVWQKEPNQGERAGVVGIFSGITADGLFSSAIKSAIKDGLLALAKIKHVDINHNYQIRRGNGLYSLAKTTMTTSAIVSAKLQDIKIIEENNKLVIYVWLLEAESKPE